MTQTIIEIEFGDAIGKRRKKHMIDKLKNHFIVCGYGRVGRGAAAELLHAGVPFVVVDNDPERTERAMSAGMLAVAADATRDDRCAKPASSTLAAWWRRWRPTPTTCSCCSRPRG